LTARLHARLLGGPFDGDSGIITYHEVPDGQRVEPPPSLWVWSCDNPHCPADGSHWSSDQGEALSQAARYDLDEGAEDHVHVYVYAEMTDPSLREEAEELALA
jgi:hypothetical protein